MISLVLTNRNREIRIVERCLQSLKKQTNNDFECYLVDYGSEENYLKALLSLLNNYPQLHFISCPTKGQLWNKSRAINIVLKKCDTPYFFVGDIDMVYAPNFIEKLYQLADKNVVTYFQVGFLDQKESVENKDFENYIIKHKSTNEATGMTLYPTERLKSINGYDEFYHGWGAEDSDVHARLANFGTRVRFFDDEILLLHQWHAKNYRTRKSKEPFHSQLELINHKYYQFSKDNKVIKANVKFQFGVVPSVEEHTLLKSPLKKIIVLNEKIETDAFLNGYFNQLPKGYYEIEFKVHAKYWDFKNRIRKIIGKKAFNFYSMDEVNDRVLLFLINNYRNNPYWFRYKTDKQKISLKIKI